eukprot:724058_1
MSSEDRIKTIIIATCAMMLIVAGGVLIGMGANSGSQSTEVYPVPHDHCIIEEFNSYYCQCSTQTEVDCDVTPEDVDFFQYMYLATANETCGNQTIKSTKDECELLNNKPIPYNTGTEVPCHIEDCDGFFVFQDLEQIENDMDAQILVGLG